MVGEPMKTETEERSPTCNLRNASVTRPRDHYLTVRGVVAYRLSSRMVLAKLTLSFPDIG